MKTMVEGVFFIPIWVAYLASITLDGNKNDQGFGTLL
jgi:hypothetical protein